MPPPAAGALLDEIGRALFRRFEPSQIDLDSPARAGTVTRRGVLLKTRTPVPAKPFRVFALGGVHRVAPHVMDFARVDIGTDGALEVDSTPRTVRWGRSS